MSILCALVHDCLIYVEISLEILNSSQFLLPPEITAKFFESRGQLLTNCLVFVEPSSSQSAATAAHRSTRVHDPPIDHSVQRTFADDEIEKLYKLCASIRHNLIRGSATMMQHQRHVKALTDCLFRISIRLRHVSGSSPDLQVGSTLYGCLYQYGFRDSCSKARQPHLLTNPFHGHPPPVIPSEPRVTLTVSLELYIIMDILDGLRILKQEGDNQRRPDPPPMHLHMTTFLSKNIGLFNKLCAPNRDFSLYGAHLHAARDVVCRMMPGPSRVTFKNALQYVVRPLLADDMFRTGRFYTELREGAQMEAMLLQMCSQRLRFKIVYNYVKDTVADLGERRRAARASTREADPLSSRQPRTRFLY
ncbi:hypothetical protein CPB85DRAFT_1441954 [Mucidula mucida]|nr:hypothetical protein CPB85DRAFT_1441954 [Mucidula mucida]